MNRWQYSCTITELHDPEILPPDPLDPTETPIIKDNNIYTYAMPVTLNLTGEGVEAFSPTHDIGTAKALDEAIAKVDSGEWDQHTLLLTADITYPHAISLDGMHNLTLDLNGHTLTVEPGPDAEPNVNAISDKPEVAAVCLYEDKLKIVDGSTGTGKLIVVAGPGIAYGIYATNGGILDCGTQGVINVASAGGGTAVYANGNASIVRINGDIQTRGDNSFGIESLNKSTVIVAKDVAVTGESSCGVYAASYDGGSPYVHIKGNLTVSGEKSRGVLWDADADFVVNGSITVTDGIEGVSIGKGTAVIEGGITAPNYAINARGDEGTQVEVTGNVSVQRENAVAVFAAGCNVTLKGDVTSFKKGGIGILATTGTSSGDNTVRGASVKAEGKIIAVTPLLVEGMPVTNENKKTGTDSNGYNIFENGLSRVRVMPGAFEIKAAGSSDGTHAVMPTVIATNGGVLVDYTAANGTANLYLPTAKINEIIEKSKGGEAMFDLAKAGGTIAVKLPKEALIAFSQAGLCTIVKLPIGTVTLDIAAAASVVQQASGGDLSIELKQVAAGFLPDAQKKIVKSDDIILDINIISAGSKINVFDGTLTISIYYTGSQPVTVWYLNDKGKLEKLDCTFKNGVVSFKPDHLSLYVVRPDTARPTWVNPFTDVKESDWFYGAVSFCAQHGITKGTSVMTYSPGATLTRGQFITMLLKAYGIAPIVGYTDNFADAGDTYYTGYLAAAKIKEISAGTGNNKFSPEQAITRQEMFTLLYNALKALNKLPVVDNGKTLADFTDSGDISSWATEAVTLLVKSGTISGSGGKLDLLDSSNRAQMAQILYNLLGE